MEKSASEPSEDAFDFADHRQAAVKAYRDVQRRYEDYAATVKSILDQTLASHQIGSHSIEARAKTLESFGRKAETESSDDPSRPKYESPLEDITDLAGVRVIVFFLSDVEKVD
jgi:ppGpp synthetase/RelA/SpoT-type nucleotidyltranferase